MKRLSSKMRNYKDSLIEAKKIKTESRNYISIFGTTAGKNVKAKSSLVLEFNQHMINKSMNLRAEVNIPYDFTDFKACNGQSDIIGLNSSDKYSISFGQGSGFDTHNQKLFEEFNKKYQKEPDAKTYFNMLGDYQIQLASLDEPIVWDMVDEEAIE